MIIGIPKEIFKGEKRVATSVETIESFCKTGAKVFVEKGAGISAGFSDVFLIRAGAQIKTTKEVFASNIILKVHAPTAKEITMMKSGSKLCCLLDPYNNKEIIKKLAAKNIKSFAMEFMPRISRAQSMDVLSSQSNIAGYKAVLDAVAIYSKAVPLFMTSAGTIPPANFCVIGAGVAGLQAIATAKRLGGQVSSFDVRAAVKEQVESLGATFIEVEGAEDLETKAGYAKEASAAYKKKQALALAKTLESTDIIISTALIPGRKAPLIVTKQMLKKMPNGAIAIDLASEQGGNIEGSVAGEVKEIEGVQVIGCKDINSSVAETCSNLYAKNLWNFLSPHIDEEIKDLVFDYEDETIIGTLITKDKQIVNNALLVEKKAPVKKKKTSAKKASVKKKVVRKKKSK